MPKLKNMAIDMPSMRDKMDVVDQKRLSRLKEAKDNKDFRTMIDHWADEKLTPKILSAKQRMAIYLLTDMVRNPTNDWVAARLNVSLPVMLKWRNDPLFIREMDKEITKRLNIVRLAAIRNINKAVTRGDLKTTKWYLEMTGDFSRKYEDVTNKGEEALSDDELEKEIAILSKQLTASQVPSAN